MKPNLRVCAITPPARRSCAWFEATVLLLVLLSLSCASKRSAGRWRPTAGLTVASDPSGWTTHVEVESRGLAEESVVLRIQPSEPGTPHAVSVARSRGVSAEHLEAVRSHFARDREFSEQLIGDTIWLVVPVELNPEGQLVVDGSYVVAKPLVRTRPRFPMDAGRRGWTGHVFLQPTIAKDGSARVGDYPPDIRVRFGESFWRAVEVALSQWRYSPRYEGLPIRGIRFEFGYE